MEAHFLFTTFLINVKVLINSCQLFSIQLPVSYQISIDYSILKNIEQILARRPSGREQTSVSESDPLCCVYTVNMRVWSPARLYI